MKASGFIAASAAVLLLLGFLHLLYTFRGPRLHPMDPDLTTKMKIVSPVITPETTVWRIWIGLNASLAIGLILFSAVYGYLAVCQSTLLFRSWFLLGLGLAVLVSYAAVSKLYFFSAPFRGIVLAGILYLVGIVVNRVA